jgi:hypothetical protein
VERCKVAVGQDACTVVKVSNAVNFARLLSPGPRTAKRLSWTQLAQGNLSVACGPH